MKLNSSTVKELSDAIDQNRLDPRELAESYLDAIESSAAGGQIFARTTKARAMAEADAAKKRASEGKRIGPMDGIPVSWKDLFDTAGVETESGSKLLEGRVPENDCVLIERATQAGCVCVGKTHLSELAFSGLGVNPNTATPPNHHNPEWAPGGSSSGAAASITHDMAPVAIGSDTGGSVRIPAGWNSLVGLKTTAERLPNDGVVPLCSSFDTAGPLAKTVEDAAMMFEVLDGSKVNLSDLPAVSDLSFLICDTLVMDDCDSQPISAFQASADRLAAKGAKVTHQKIPLVEEATAIGPTLFPYEAYQQWGKEIEAQPDLMFEPVRNRFYGGKDITREQYDDAWASLNKMRLAFDAILGEYDGMILPTGPKLPPKISELMADFEYFWDANLMALRNTRVGNLMGLCALTIPTREDACGFMVFCRPNQEERLLQIGKAIEATVRG